MSASHRARVARLERAREPLLAFHELLLHALALRELRRELLPLRLETLHRIAQRGRELGRSRRRAARGECRRARPGECGARLR